MNGHEYEYFCADKLRISGFSNVKVTKGSGDQGIDVIAYKNGKKYAIQCKYYTSPVGNKAIQEAFAGAKFYDCDIAAVMTNNTFTKSARELANKLGVELWENELEKKTYSKKENSFWNVFNIFLVIIGLIYIFLLFYFDDFICPVVQFLYALSMTLAGLFGSFCKTNKDSIVACCLFYFITIIMAIANSIAHKSIHLDAFVFLIPFLYSFFKTYKLVKPQKAKCKSNQKVKDMKISLYCNMPCQFSLFNKSYNFDNVDDINSIPLDYSYTFVLDGIPYTIISYLIEFAKSCYYNGNQEHAQIIINRLIKENYYVSNEAKYFILDHNNMPSINSCEKYNQSLSIWKDDVLLISNMQRKYKIGYRHASNIINVLFVNGYISEKNALGQRTALCSKEIIEEFILKNIELLRDL